MSVEGGSKTVLWNVVATVSVEGGSNCAMECGSYVN